MVSIYHRFLDLSLKLALFMIKTLYRVKLIDNTNFSNFAEKSLPRANFEFLQAILFIVFKQCTYS